MKAQTLGIAAGLLAASLVSAQHAQAFPGFLTSKKPADLKVHSTQVVVLKKGALTAVTVMPDYEGPIEPFALVLVVPSDVTEQRVTTLKRDFVDRIDQISAPRFHEFWEQDPCDPGPLEQEWERVLKADPNGGFLGGGPSPGGGPKVAKELSMDVKAKQKEGEYTFSLVGKDESIASFLKGKGYVVPDGAEAAVAPYVQAGNRLVLAQVDSNRIELVGGERAQLSPIRFWTEQPYDTIPDRVGLLNAPAAPDKQELLVYVLDPEQRYEVKNYKNLFPPTNIEVDFAVKERVGEFYAALQDMILAKNPGSFLLEYAWHGDGCGQPCATDPIDISELLSLGADVFEQSVPADEKNPKPPERSKEEEDAFKDTLKDLKPKEKKAKIKADKEDRETVAARKALVARHKYILSRMHYRYDAAALPSDPKIGPAAGALEGGIWVPEGKDHTVSTETKPATVSKFQTRYNNFHPWVPVIQCPNPDRYKWGKSPRDYRGLRKTWIAEDLTRKSRTQIKPAEVVKTAIPWLGLTGAAQPAAADAGADGGTDAGAKKSGKCGCRVPGGSDSGSPLALIALATALGFVRRRARH
ncbi:MAG TPA: DUF2330 domain-containing protein [Polyangiaceae bacterium]